MLAGFVGASLLAALLLAGLAVPAWRQPASMEPPPPSATPLGMALVGVRVDEPPAGATGTRSGYLLPFEIVSIRASLAIRASSAGSSFSMDCFGPSAATAVRTERKKAGRNFMGKG